ncbi:hypothetical protein [Aquabacterium humicola]|uniref:hypothetical protein n=1 Tax=Aquabacterium humicola TaxID=3237377 RepID=UPI0025435A06|nr:hypothetical protein [Rubrivivax pictus]
MTDEELCAFKQAEVAALRRHVESMRRFARSLEGQGAQAELLRQDTLELASLVDPDRTQDPIATAAIDRAKCV